MPALAVIYYRRNGGWLNSRTHLHPDDLLTLALFFFHSASFSPGRYDWLSLFWPLVHLIDGWLDLHQPAIAWLLTIHGVGPRGEIIVPVVKVLLRSLSVILRVSGLEEAEAQNTVMSTIKVTCCCCSTQTTASEVFSQKECEGERRFCLFNTNSTAKTHPHTRTHPWQTPSASSVFSWRGSTVRMTPARQSAKPDRALTSSSRQEPEQVDSLTPQAPTLLISLFYSGGSAYWRWSGIESRGLIFCQNGQESMLQNQRVSE